MDYYADMTGMNKSHTRKLILSITLLVALLYSSQWRLNPVAQTTGSIYLPLITTVGSLSQPQDTRINIPYFNNGIIWAETAIAWFGRLTPTENYADIRLGSNDDELFIRVEIFDRLLWYDKSPILSDLANWDAVTVYINTQGNQATSLTDHAYQFVAQLNWFEDRADYQNAFHGSSSGWQQDSLPFDSETIYRGDEPNNNTDDRGWVATFHIPFSSLGLATKPDEGETWGLSVSLHDRDDLSGSIIPDKTWPVSFDSANPSTWNQIRFGLPGFTPRQASNPQTTTIRQGLNGSSVVDAAVGGTTGNLCPGDSFFIWNQWAEANFAGAEHFNIQNQSDVADWPCFAKYYVTFPLNAIPPGKVILSAELTLHQFGNSDPNNAQPSLIQVFTVAQDWSEQSITWNNAPYALENVSQSWIDPLPGFPGWPGVERSWDVSRAVAQVYQTGGPLRLALYEADSAQHSGKHFVSSDTGDWNAVGRPTLIVTYGNP